MTGCERGPTVLQALSDFARRGAPREARLMSLLLWLSIGAASAIVLSAIFVVFDGYSALPFWDQWGYVSPADIRSQFLSQHNEHRILLSKLIMLVDEIAFGGANKFNLFVIYLTQAAHAALLITLARRAGLDGYCSTLASTVTIGALFTLHQYENFTWGFQTPFVIVFAAATAAFASVAYCAERRRPLFALFAILACAIATSEMANGVLAGLTCVALTIALRIGRRIVALLAVSAALTLVIYLAFYTPVPHHTSVLDSLTNPLPAVAYLLAYLGGPLATSVAAALPGTIRLQVQVTTIAVFSGAVLCCANLAALCCIVARRAEVRPAVFALFAINVFVLGSAAVTALGRLGFGLEQALASRYSIAGLLMTAVTFILGLALAAPLRPGRAATRLAVAGSLVLLGLLLIVQPVFMGAAEGRRNGRNEATTALLAEVKDENALKQAFIAVDPVLRGARELKQQGNSIYADPWSGWLGRKLGDIAPLPRAVCDGTINPLEPIAGADGARVTGVVWYSPFMLRPKVILIDAQERVVGYAFVDYRLILARFYRPVRRPNVATGFAGHVKAGYAAPLRAVLLDRNDALICVIGVAN